jgi:hypothetical protein
MRYKREKWVLTLSTAAGLWILIYIAFAVAAGIELYRGLIIDLLMGVQ